MVTHSTAAAAQTCALGTGFFTTRSSVGKKTERQMFKISDTLTVMAGEGGVDVSINH